jgi:hypothetical protein
MKQGKVPALMNNKADIAPAGTYKVDAKVYCIHIYVYIHRNMSYVIYVYTYICMNKKADISS